MGVYYTSSNCKSDIDNLYPNGILLLWDNDSKHKSKMSLDYYILVSISWKVMYIKKIQSFKSDIEEYCMSCATHLSSIVGDFMREKNWCMNFK